MDSIPPELTTTNVPPTDHQTSHIQRVIAEREQLGRELNHQYYVARASLEDVEYRRDQNRRDIVRLKAVISPVRRIPREILAEIFHFCVVNSRFINYSYSVADPRHAPVILTHVCSFWRDVGINTPRLWDRLSLYFSKHASNSGMESMVRELANRSTPHPLRIDVGTADVEYENGQPLDILPALATLQDVCERMETLHVDLPLPHFQPLLAVPIPAFPRLRDLSITLATELQLDRPVSLEGILAFFQSCPRLVELKIDIGFMAPLVDIFASDFPWSSLTHLHMSAPLNFLEARSVLARGALLQRCVFENLVADRPPDQPDLTTLHTLPALKRLAVYHTSTLPSSILFDIFAFPNLRDLEIDVWGWSEDALIALLERSHFALASLSLRNVGIPADELVHFLSLNPTLEALVLRAFPVPGVIEALMYVPTAMSTGRERERISLLPRLTQLSIEADAEELASGGSGYDLVRMLRSRWDIENDAPDRPARLARVHLEISGEPLGSRAEEGIRHLESEGLVLDHFTRGA
ncbi:hypothetical protein C8R43DRAFT_1082735 [Mycena crocata]|nr:hypothetical protein C8R43DRAFT_1082735 [Mycena crocata]